MSSDGGKQFGPRYLLVAGPIIILLMALSMSILRDQSKLLYRIFMTLFAASMVTRGYLNTYRGTQHLVDDHQCRVRPAHDLIGSSDLTCVAANNPFIPLEMAAAYGEKTFIRTEDQRLKKGL